MAGKHISSVKKANVGRAGRLWREANRKRRTKGVKGKGLLNQEPHHRVGRGAFCFDLGGSREKKKKAENKGAGAGGFKEERRSRSH